MFTLLRRSKGRSVSLVGLITLVALALPAWPAAAAETRPGDLFDRGRVLMLGDSITQDGRYVSFVEYYLGRSYRAAWVDVVCIGLSSETVAGLTEPDHPFPRPCILERLGRALKVVKPAVVVACYGMNDGIYHPSSPERRAAYEAGLRQLMNDVHAAGAHLVIMTPPGFDVLPIRERAQGADATAFGYGGPYRDYDAVLAEFAEVASQLASDRVTVVDLHRVWETELQARRALDPTFTFSPDGVHPKGLGHLLIARTLLTELGYHLPAAELDAELARVQADPVFELVAERRQLRSEAWLPYVGYTGRDRYRSATVDAAERAVARLSAEIRACQAPFAGEDTAAK